MPSIGFDARCFSARVRNVHNPALRSLAKPLFDSASVHRQ